MGRGVWEKLERRRPGLMREGYLGRGKGWVFQAEVQNGQEGRPRPGLRVAEWRASIAFLGRPGCADS